MTIYDCIVFWVIWNIERHRSREDAESLMLIFAGLVTASLLPGPFSLGWVPVGVFRAACILWAYNMAAQWFQHRRSRQEVRQ
jgi:hypothetical protein